MPFPSAVAWLRRGVFGVALMLVLVIGGTAVHVWSVARADDRPEVDAIVVLGAAQYNGTPSEIFASRLDHAKNLYDEGVARHIVTSGGNREGDEYTEARAGADWLTGHGVPSNAVIPVGEGNDTLRSLDAVERELSGRDWHSVVIVSDPWHSLRARVMAEDVGMEAWTSPTHSGPIVQTRSTQARYIVRETGALLYYRLSKNPVDYIGGGGVS